MQSITNKNSLIIFTLILLYLGGKINSHKLYSKGQGDKKKHKSRALSNPKKYLNLNKVLIELPSKTKFYTSLYSNATLGMVSNSFHNKVNLGKAGRNRWLGNKSNVRGVAMNPVDHPHGGGEGKKSNPSFKRSPWGKIYKWNNKKRIFIK